MPSGDFRGVKNLCDVGNRRAPRYFSRCHRSHYSFGHAPGGSSLAGALFAGFPGKILTSGSDNIRPPRYVRSTPITSKCQVARTGVEPAFPWSEHGVLPLDERAAGIPDGGLVSSPRLAPAGCLTQLRRGHPPLRQYLAYADAHESPQFGGDSAILAQCDLLEGRREINRDANSDVHSGDDVLLLSFPLALHRAPSPYFGCRRSRDVKSPVGRCTTALNAVRCADEETVHDPAPEFRQTLLADVPRDDRAATRTPRATVAGHVDRVPLAVVVDA